MAEHGVRRGCDAVVAAIAGGATNRQAALTAGVGERTVYRWLNDPEVCDRINDARAEFRRRTMDRLVALNTKALYRLEQLLDDIDTPPAVVARLIDMTLNQSQRWVEVEELRQRIERLTTEAPDDIAARVREALGPVNENDAE
jgi:hypothetical protein